ncbi:hypothetical protein M1D88_18620 [Arthrobacter sp. R1-13]
MPDEMAVVLAEHIYAAARADMEFVTSLTSARHHIENLLSAFSHAVCVRDASALEELIRDVAVSLDGHIPCGTSKAAKIMDWFDGTDPATTQTITNISLRFDENNVLYSATYQDWNTASPPQCMAIGRFTGRLKAGPQVWRWEEHKVATFTDHFDHPEAVVQQNPTCYPARSSLP